MVGRAADSSISPPDLLGCLRRIEARGVIETAHRVQRGEKFSNDGAASMNFLRLRQVVSVAGPVAHDDLAA